MRICVVTSVEAAQEPRAPRHASWLSAMGLEVIFVDSAPFGAPRRPVKCLQGLSNFEWHTHRFAMRTSSPTRLAIDRARKKISLAWFAQTGIVCAGALSTRAFGLDRKLREVAADVYLSHNAETLWPAFLAAEARKASLIYDSMEFHSDMGEGQVPLERKLIQAIEETVLPRCAHVLASSAQLADALAASYGIVRPLPLDNVPPIEESLPQKPNLGLALYWRNAVVGFGQRGLEEALVALTLTPDDVVLHLQGRMPVDGGSAMRRRIAELRLSRRVIFHPPYFPDDAVKEAARYHVGLCLERKGCRNHDLTTSNKIFDYHMAGLAVVASDLPGLRGVVERSRGGLLFEPGSPKHLAECILRIRAEPGLQDRLAQNARAFALREGNRDHEMKRFRAALGAVLARIPSKEGIAVGALGKNSHFKL